MALTCGMKSTRKAHPMSMSRPSHFGLQQTAKPSDPSLSSTLPNSSHMYMSQSDADCDDGGGDGNCTPQPMHSVPSAQIGYPASGPMSSQSPSEARLHGYVQRICAPVKPTIRAATKSRTTTPPGLCLRQPSLITAPALPHRCAPLPPWTMARQYTACAFAWLSSRSSRSTWPRIWIRIGSRSCSCSIPCRCYHPALYL